MSVAMDGPLNSITHRAVPPPPPPIPLTQSPPESPSEEQDENGGVTMMMSQEESGSSTGSAREFDGSGAEETGSISSSVGEEGLRCRCGFTAFGMLRGGKAKCLNCGLVMDVG